MKTKSFIHRSFAALMVGAIVAFHVPPVCAASASPSELLEKGIYSEETKGDLDGAIAIYQQVLSEVKAGQSLAAQAQFRLAQCYLKKNKSAEANAAFEKLIHDFPGEKDLVAKARGRLPAQPKLGPVPWVDGERLQLALKLPAGLEIGVFETRADLVESGGKKIWRVGRLMGGGGQSISTVDVEADTFRPITSHWKHTMIGEVSAVFGAGEVELRKPGSTEVQKITLNDTVFDNEESFHLFRRLPLKVGYKSTVPVITTLGGGTVLPIEVEVQKKETVSVPAGKYDCLRLQIIVPPTTFWFSDDEHRYLVKFEGGGAMGELTSISHRKPGESYEYRNEATGVSFTLPADWIVHFRAKQKPAGPDSFLLIDAKAEADGAVLDVYATDSLKEDSKKSARAWAETEIKDNYSKTLKDFKVRADSWKDETVAGQPGASFMADYTEGGKPRVGRAIFSTGPKVSGQFMLAAAPDKFDALSSAFDSVIASFKHTK
jgi:hypothetical protein